ncbi:hypothetical protein WA026_019599 [Henosepilachna vigintioctopunctata]|uniref:Uncharacterized protein n=1 Tax=Henosepilachna vigintioctopunctata TaxID=420089 RepID=A0AAW1TR42_9CUCU
MYRKWGVLDRQGCHYLNILITVPVDGISRSENYSTYENENPVEYSYGRQLKQAMVTVTIHSISDSVILNDSESSDDQLGKADQMLVTCIH